MKLYGVKSPADLAKEKKSEFFTEIRRDWAKFKDEKRKSEESPIRKVQTTLEKPKQPSPEITEKATQAFDRKRHRREKAASSLPRESVGQIIKSEPNEKQTDDLKIRFKPNEHFVQGEDYLYPVVKMPTPNSGLKLPRAGRSNQKGYKENDFYNQLKHQLKRSIADIDMTNDVHMVIPNFNKPYEPDIVLFDENLNLYIDIEIDEPYDGYYRYPTHHINPDEDNTKKDNIRDLFFTESGWVVIRFTEKQVHCQTDGCIDYIKNVVSSIYNREFNTEVKCGNERQWDYEQSIRWQKAFYREKYLGIDRFQKQDSYKEIEIDSEENESIESVIRRTKISRSETWDSSIAFNEETHKYFAPKDETGNAEYISVTTLIERFFPFDLKRYIEKKAKEENRSEGDVLIEYLMIRDEAAEKGTFLHKQIENFLKGSNFDSDFKEFKLFIDFYDNEIKKRSLAFFDAEKKIVSKTHTVAGTIDCLFKKNDSDEYIMLDWKRSKKLTVDGHPKKYGYSCDLSELRHLYNSSYYRYCLQQNIYKYILETEYSMKISSMKLVVLHETFPKYYVLNVEERKKEVGIILNSLKYKI